MTEQLTKADCDFILECFKYTRLAYESTEYPSYEFKKKQLDRLGEVEGKVRQLRKKAE